MQKGRATKWDPLRAEWVKDTLPTVSIKKAAKFNTMGDNTALSSHTVSGTAYLRLTYLNLQCATGTVDIALVDRDGTIDSFLLLTNDSVTLQGNQYKPIHTVKGTFTIYNVGSIDVGTFVVAWEGIQ